MRWTPVRPAPGRPLFRRSRTRRTTSCRVKLLAERYAKGARRNRYRDQRPRPMPLVRSRPPYAGAAPRSQHSARLSGPSRAAQNPMIGLRVDCPLTGNCQSAADRPVLMSPRQSTSAGFTPRPPIESGRAAPNADRKRLRLATHDPSATVNLLHRSHSERP
jgi:hypothetical protein